MKLVSGIFLLVCLALCQTKAAADSRENSDHQLVGHVSVSGGTTVSVGHSGGIASLFGRFFNSIFSIYKNIGSLIGKILTDTGIGSLKLMMHIREFVNGIINFVVGLATSIIKYVLKMNINIIKSVLLLVRRIIMGINKFLESLPIIGRLFKINSDTIREITHALRKQTDGFANNEKTYLLNHKKFLLPRIKYIKMILNQLDRLFMSLTENPVSPLRNEFWITLRKLFEQQIKFVADAEKFFETNGVSGSLGINF